MLQTQLNCTYVGISSNELNILWLGLEKGVVVVTFVWNAYLYLFHGTDGNAENSCNFKTFPLNIRLMSLRLGKKKKYLSIH